jgi:hypothetical protein
VTESERAKVCPQALSDLCSLITAPCPGSLIPDLFAISNLPGDEGDVFENISTPGAADVGKKKQNPPTLGEAAGPRDINNLLLMRRVSQRWPGRAR